MSMWDLLNWLTLQDIKDELSNIKANNPSNSNSLSSSSSIEKIFLQLYRNNNDISKVDLSIVPHLKERIFGEFRGFANSNRFLGDNYSLKEIIIFLIAMTLFSYLSIRLFILDNLDLNFFVLIILVFLIFVSLGGYMSILDTFRYKKSNYNSLAKDVPIAMELKKNYSYLTPYGVYLKYYIDNTLRDIIKLLNKNPQKNDPYKTLEILYDLFDLKASTRLMDKKYNYFFWFFNKERFKMLNEPNYILPKINSKLERFFHVLLMIIPIGISIFVLRDSIYRKYSNNKYFLELRCYLNDSKSCKKLADLYKTDDVLYVKYIKKACEAKDKYSCRLLANYFFDKGDYNNALNFYQEACNLEDGLACALAGNIIEKKYHVYRGGLPLYKKACDLNISDACFIVSTYFRLDKSYNKAFSYLKKSCELGNKYGCFYAGAMCIRKEVNNCDGYTNLIQGGLNFYNKSCNLKNGEACFILGYYFYKQGFYGVEKNNEKASLYLKKACDLNYTKACKYL